MSTDAQQTVDVNALKSNVRSLLERFLDLPEVEVDLTALKNRQKEERDALKAQHKAQIAEAVANAPENNVAGEIATQIFALVAEVAPAAASGPYTIDGRKFKIRKSRNGGYKFSEVKPEQVMDLD